MNKTFFGTMPDGTLVEQYTLHSGQIACEIITYGGAIRSLRVPDRTGKPVDVVLGFDTLDDYRRQDKFIGALIGRYANRIGGSQFELNGTVYPLYANDGPNHLHGGKVGFDKQVWSVKHADDDTLTLGLCAEDGQEGYPGTLTVEVTYRLRDRALEIHYRAACDRDTVCNLTNHTYFNLGGHDSGVITQHTIQLFADAYTPTDPGSIPTGELQPVAGTLMNLREPTVIGKDVDADFDQLKWAGGYDHNWVLRGEAGTLRPAAVAACPDTGIVLKAETTQPGIQFYSGNYLDGCPNGKNGAPYAKRCGFCLETQAFPDSPHKPNFPTAVLKPGQTYDHTTVYSFSCEK